MVTHMQFLRIEYKPEIMPGSGGPCICRLRGPKSAHSQVQRWVEKPSQKEKSYGIDTNEVADEAADEAIPVLPRHDEER